MIVARQKKADEIIAMLGDELDSLFIVGCGTCVTVSMAGGEREVNSLAELLRLYFKNKKLSIQINTAVIKRQCDNEFIDEIEDEIKNNELVLSMGCGVGVQQLVERHPEKVILPGLDTSFYGATTGVGEWSERCIGCGNCILNKYMGICPIARCSKRLLNGPCGGSQDGKCEVDPEIDCGWELIYTRAVTLGQLNNFIGYEPPKDWQTYRDGGPRKLINSEYFIDNN